MEKSVLVLGGIIVDKYLLVEKYPSKGEDTLIKESFQKVGGCAINASTTMKNLGCTPYIVSKLGSDENGIFVKNYIETEEFKNDFIKLEKDKNTGYCLTIVEEDGERTFMTYTGCEDEFEDSMLKEDVLKCIEFVYLTGYYLLDENYFSKKLQLLNKLKEYGAKIMFDPGPLVSIANTKVIDEVLNLTDVLVPNDKEKKDLCRAFNIREEDFEKACFDKGIDCVIVKKGAKGADLYTKYEKYSFGGYEVKVVDTTGAGDSFAGGCIYGFLMKCTNENVLKIGCACGAIATTKVGPNAKFKAEDVIKLMEGE